MPRISTTLEKYKLLYTFIFFISIYLSVSLHLHMAGQRSIILTIDKFIQISAIFWGKMLLFFQTKRISGEIDIIWIREGGEKREREFILQEVHTCSLDLILMRFEQYFNPKFLMPQRGHALFNR